MQKLINRIRFRRYLKQCDLPIKAIHIATSYFCPMNKRLVTRTKRYEV